MIENYYEITCDNCGCAEHFKGTKKISVELAKDNGWLITSKGDHFCDEKCQDEERKSHKQDKH